ncbi:MAG: FHA domain-containing protein [bacterium]
MANFVLLKGGEQYKVFDFDGNVARVGSGEHVDLQLADTGTEQDIFLLLLTDRGYDLQPIAPNVTVSVNGTLVERLTPLPEQAKVSFLDYLMVVSYGGTQPVEQPTAQAAAARPAPSPPAGDAPTQRPAATPPPKASDTPTRTMDVVQPGASTEPGVPPSGPKPAATPPVAPAPPPAKKKDPSTAPGNIQTPPPPPRQPVEAKTELIHHAPPPPPRQPEPVREAPKPRIEADYALVGLSGQHAGKVFPIDAEEFVVGRDRSCNLAIERDEKGRPDSAISREHFTIVSREGELSVVDRNSKLRTYVNGKVLEPDQREPIAPEDIISIPSPGGEVKFRLCFADDPNPYPDIKKSFPWLPVIGLVSLIVILAFVLYKFLGSN